MEGQVGVGARGRGRAGRALWQPLAHGKICVEAKSMRVRSSGGEGGGGEEGGWG